MSAPSPPASAAAIVMEASQEPDLGMYAWLAVTTGLPDRALTFLRWNDIDLDGDAFDQDTVTLLRAYLAHCSAQAAILGIERVANAFVFSRTPDGSTPPEPGFLAARIGLTGELPRHTAAELVEAGADVRALNWRFQRGLSRIQRRPRA